MSATLCIRRTPEPLEEMRVNLPLRDVLCEATFGDKQGSSQAMTVDSKYLDFFRGARAMTYGNQDDYDTLNKMIEILEDGGTLDLQMEY